jgi:hypothetical protein
LSVEDDLVTFGDVVKSPPQERRLRLPAFLRANGKLIVATVGTAAVLVLTLGGAGVVAWQSAFVSKTGFAGLSDYVGLFTAAFGSSAAAAVVSVFGLWWHPKGAKLAAS